jgi:enterochelin esterase family protein
MINELQLSETTVADPAGGYARRVWRSTPAAESSRPACIFLDAELYLERVEALKVLGGLNAAGRLPELSWVLVSQQDAAARHQDYTCNETYAKFIAEQVLPAGAPGGNYVCGLSLSGLAAAHLALLYPQLFRGALCQSGSFWWANERFSDIARRLGPRACRVWLSVGDQETETGVSHPPSGLRQELSQLESVANAAQTLTALGCTVNHRVLAGGHEPAQWQAELPEALAWLTG